MSSLKRLKNSERKSSEIFSVTRNVRATVRSRLTSPGPNSTFAAELPNVNGAGMPNAEGSNQRSGVRSPRGRFPSRNRSGRWPPVVFAGFPLTLGVTGKPFCSRDRLDCREYSAHSGRAGGFAAGPGLPRCSSPIREL